MTYVALLRGINTGRTLKMEDLRRIFESLGFGDVRTVLATGNVDVTTRTWSTVERIVSAAR